MPEFVDTAVKDIDDRLRQLKDEISRLDAARAALTGGSPRRPARSTTARRAQRRPGRRRAAQPASSPARSRGGTRANQALEHVRERPGITIPEIAKAMKIQPNYLYRVLPRLAAEGRVKREGQGWHPAGRR